MDNEKMRVLAMVQLAREHMQFGRIKEADAVLQNLLHGDILADYKLARAADQVQWDRGIKALAAHTNTRAVWITAEHSGIIGELTIRMGGDEFLLEQFGPVLKQLTGG